MERNRDYSQEGYQVIWILHDHRYNKKRATAAEIWLQEHPHYFTNFDEEGGNFYDQWSSFDRGCRTDRSDKAFVDPTKIVRRKAHKNSMRKTWPLYLVGDLMDKGELPSQGLDKVKSFRPFAKVRYLYRVIFRHLLEKCCH